MRFLTLLMVFFFFIGCGGSGEKSYAPSDKETSLKSIIPSSNYALLIVESKSCLYCAQLKKDLKTDENLKQALKGMEVHTLLYESYKPVKTNIGGQLREVSEKDLAIELDATSFPYLIFYDRTGNIILRIPGYMPPDKLACVVNYVKGEEFKRENLQEYLQKRCT